MLLHQILNHIIPSLAPPMSPQSSPHQALTILLPGKPGSERSEIIVVQIGPGCSLAITPISETDPFSHLGRPVLFCTFAQQALIMNRSLRLSSLGLSSHAIENDANSAGAVITPCCLKNEIDNTKYFRLDIRVNLEVM